MSSGAPGHLPFNAAPRVPGSESATRSEEHVLLGARAEKQVPAGAAVCKKRDGERLGLEEGAPLEACPI